MKKYIIATIALLLTIQTYGMSESEVNSYKKWSIQDPKISEFNFQKQDCIWTTSDFSWRWDLISSLIMDQIFRNKVIKKQYIADFITKLDDISLLTIYTPDYLIGIDKLITKKLQKNFYARYICNVWKNIDIIAGDYSSQSRLSTILLLRKNNTIYILQKNIGLYNNVATWGDVTHCSATMKNNSSIEWSCFVWFASDNTWIIWDIIKTYIISLKTGKILKINSHTKLL